jgi:hypothetical protein
MDERMKLTDIEWKHRGRRNEEQQGKGRNKPSVSKEEKESE